MLPQQTALDREFEAGTIFGRLSVVLKQKRAVDRLDVDTPVLDRFDCAGYLEELLGEDVCASNL